MIVLKATPRATEKAYRLSTAQNTYVFDVTLGANRQQITEEIEARYGVKVVSVRTLVQKGKAVRFSRGKNRYPGSTTRKDTKKAYVTLVEGDSIKVFDTEEATDDKKSKKEEKK